MNYAKAFRYLIEQGDDEVITTDNKTYTQVLQELRGKSDQEIFEVVKNTIPNVTHQYAVVSQTVTPKTLMVGKKRVFRDQRYFEVPFEFGANYLSNRTRDNLMILEVQYKLKYEVMYIELVSQMNRFVRRRAWSYFITGHDDKNQPFAYVRKEYKAVGAGQSYFITPEGRAKVTAMVNVNV